MTRRCHEIIQRTWETQGLHKKTDPFPSNQRHFSAPTSYPLISAITAISRIINYIQECILTGISVPQDGGRDLRRRKNCFFQLTTWLKARWRYHCRRQKNVCTRKELWKDCDTFKKAFLTTTFILAAVCRPNQWNVLRRESYATRKVSYKINLHTICVMLDEFM